MSQFINGNYYDEWYVLCTHVNVFQPLIVFALTVGNTRALFVYSALQSKNAVCAHFEAFNIQSILHILCFYFVKQLLLHIFISIFGKRKNVFVD